MPAIAPSAPNFPGFTSPVFLPTGNGPFAVVTADFDGDGRPDLASVDIDNQLLIFWNAGGGAFPDEPSSWATPLDPFDLKAGDLDGDGDQDVIVAFASFPAGGVIVFENNGKRRFSAREPIGVGVQPRGVTLADLDDDGDLDAAVADQLGASVYTLMNDDSGNFETPTQHPVGEVPLSVDVGDLDDDGDLDIATANAISGSVSLVINLGKGRFDTSYEAIHGAGIRDSAFIDFDQDGDVDLAIAGLPMLGAPLGGMVAINNGDEEFESIQPIITGVAASVIRVADVNQDRVLDIGLSASQQEAVAIAYGDGSGGFALATLVNVGGDGVRGFQFDDLDHDGDLDLVATNTADDRLAIVFNQLIAPDASSADLTADHIVNGSDLAHLLTQWGSAGPGDLNQDGVVNGADLVQLLSHWGAAPKRAPYVE